MPASAGAHPPEDRSPRKLLALAAAMLVVGTFVGAAYLPVLHCRAFNIDDAFYLTDNWLVLNPSMNSVHRFFGEVTRPSTVPGYYQPLAMVSLMLDVVQGGSPENLLPFHRTSLALHVANTMFVIALLYMLSANMPGAIIGGLIFGLHPLTVEPIAWIADRKTVLATFFGLLCFICYVACARSRDARSVEPHGSGGGRPRSWLPAYLTAIATYVLALLAKPTTTPIAVLLFVLDWWPLNRLRRSTLWEKVPFLAIGAVSAVISFISQANTASARTPGANSVGRIILVLCHDVVFYFRKLLWPADLSPHYPVPAPLGIAHPAIIAGVVGTLTLVVLLLVSLRRTRAAASAAVFFFLAILPTTGIIGFTNVLTSDKYVYFPIVGLTIAIAYGVRALWQRGRQAQMGITLAAVAVTVAMTAATRACIANWKDSESLAKQMVRIAPESPQSYVMLATALSDANKPDDAIAAFNMALAKDPDNAPAHYGLAWLLASMNRDEEAIAHYTASLKTTHRPIASHNNLANLLARNGRYDQALEHYQFVLTRRPDSAEAHYNLATTLLALNRPQEAFEHLQTAMQLRPDRPDIVNNLAMASAASGNPQGAAELYQRSLQLNPQDATTRYNYANTLATLGRHQEAVIHYHEAIRLRPDYASAHNNLANSLLKLGRQQEALAEFRETLRIEPGHAKAHANLADALADAGDAAGAIPHYQQALRSRPTARLQYRFGLALLRLGRQDEAAGAFREALRLDAGFEDAARQLASLTSAPQSAPR